jgi:capsular polysaccharide biosynthesis protein
MTNIEEKIKATAAPILLSIIAAMIGFFGSFSLKYLSKMSDKIDVVTMQYATQQKDIDALQKGQDRIEGFYQDVIKSQAVKEEIYQIPKRTR